MIFFDLPPWMASLFVFIFGTLLGSFLNVCVYRLPRQSGLWASLKSLLHPPSACPRCGTPIRPIDNLPVIGWLRLRGRCHSCRSRIAIRYPAVELLNGLLAVGLYWLEVPPERFADLADSPLITPLGPTSDECAVSDLWQVHLRFAFHFLLCEVLLVAALIDFDLQVIPKSVTDPFLPIGVAGMAVGGMYLLPVATALPPFFGDVASLLESADEPQQFRPDWIADHPHLHGVACGVVGLIAGGLPVLLIRWVGAFTLKQEAVGLGDVYLMAVAGAFLGWQPALVSLALSLMFAMATILTLAVAGTLRVHGGTMIPYGPFLSLGSAATLFGWPWIWPRTLHLFDAIVAYPVAAAALATGFFTSLVVTLAAIQVVKRIVGIRQAPGHDGGVWTAADQNHYLAGERPETQTGQWSRPDWPGASAGRGQSFGERWKNGTRTQ